MSNVCRYFLNNTCRYGSRCRFSHNVSESGSASSGSSTNPYVYIRDQSSSPQNWKRDLSNTEVREIIDRIAEEANQVEYEHMWPLTCLSVVRDAPNVPGWEDYSMEEIRAAAYASKAAGRFDEYLDFFMSLKQKAKENRAIFLRPGKTAEDVVRSMFSKHNKETPQPPTTPSTPFSFSSSQIPAFGGRPSTSSAPGSFGTSGFGSQASSTPIMGNSPFGSGSSSKDPSAGIFAMAARGFSQSSFNQSQISNMNDTAMETATDISQSQNAMSPFHQNIFGQVPHLPPSGGTFKGTAPSGFPSADAPFIGTSSAAPNRFSSFGAPSAGPPSTLVGLSAVFTPMDQLTEMELEQFKATTFTLDKLPLRPPPHELC